WRGQNRAPQHIRPDLVPHGAAAAAAANSDFLRMTPSSLLGPLKHDAVDEGHAFHDCPDEVCRAMLAAKAKEGCAQILIPVWYTFAMQEGVEDQRCIASLLLREKVLQPPREWSVAAVKTVDDPRKCIRPVLPWPSQLPDVAAPFDADQPLGCQFDIGDQAEHLGGTGNAVRAPRSQRSHSSDSCPGVMGATENLCAGDMGKCARQVRPNIAHLVRRFSQRRQDVAADAECRGQRGMAASKGT